MIRLNVRNRDKEQEEDGNGDNTLTLEKIHQRRLQGELVTTDGHSRMKTRPAFDNVKPKDWYFVFD